MTARGGDPKVVNENQKRQQEDRAAGQQGERRVSDLTFRAMRRRANMHEAVVSLFQSFLALLPGRPAVLLPAPSGPVPPALPFALAAGRRASPLPAASPPFAGGLSTMFLPGRVC